MAESSLPQEDTAPKVKKPISGIEADMNQVLKNQGDVKLVMAKEEPNKKVQKDKDTVDSLLSHQGDAHTLLKNLAGEREPNESYEIPVPEKHLEVNLDLATAWVQEETDPELRSLRQKIIDSIDCVSFSDFKDALSTTAQQLRARLEGSAYGVIWDHKPHSSKRWVSKLASHDLSENPPTQESFFTSGWEARNGYPTLENMVNQGVTTIVVMDDAIYSGDQIINRAIQPIYKYTQSPQFKTAHPNTHLKIVIAAPFMTNRFLENQTIKDTTAMGLVEVIPPVKIMPTLTERFSPAEKVVLAKHEGKLNSNDEEPFYQAPTTVFDHRVPDGHSFPQEVSRVLKFIPEKPYGKEVTVYYRQEEQSYEGYKRPFLSEPVG